MLTTKEKECFTELAYLSMSGSVGDILDLCDNYRGLQSAGGVVSSLIKKGYVMADGDHCLEEAGQEYPLLWPIHPEYGAVFWCDYESDDSGEALLKSMIEGENND